MLHRDHISKLARRPIDPIKQEKNIGDEPRSDVLIELFNCGGGVCGEGAVGAGQAIGRPSRPGGCPGRDGICRAIPRTEGCPIRPG